MHLKMLSAKWWPFSLSLNALIVVTITLVALATAALNPEMCL